VLAGRVERSLSVPGIPGALPELVLQFLDFLLQREPLHEPFLPALVELELQFLDILLQSKPIREPLLAALVDRLAVLVALSPPLSLLLVQLPGQDLQGGILRLVALAPRLQRLPEVRQQQRRQASQGG
jgi:hypothetical protein